VLEQLGRHGLGQHLELLHATGPRFAEQRHALTVTRSDLVF
jgi:hypothetical protein